MPDFGIGEAITAAITSFAGADAASVLAPALEGALVGGGLGGVESGVTGGNIGKGILHGAEGGSFTGGGIGIGGDILGSALGTTAADAIGGAAGGALGSTVTHSNPLVGALEGGASGAFAGLNAPSGSTGSGSGGASSGGVSGSVPTPSSVSPSGDVAGDFSQGLSQGQDFSNLSAGNQVPSVNALAAQNPTSPGQITASSSGGSFPGPQGGPVNLSGGADIPISSASGTDSFVNANSGGGGGFQSTLSSPIADSFAGGGSSGGGSAPSSGAGSFADTAANNATYASLNSGGGSPAGGGAASTSGGNLVNNWDSSSLGFNKTNLGNFGSMLAANPGADVAALGLGADVLKGNQLAKGEKQLQQEAGQFAGQGAQLENYLQTGTLPPGVGAAINQTAEARKAQIRSQYAQQGGSGSSAEQQDLAAVDAWAQGQGADTAMKLLSTGINESGLAAGLYSDISKNAMQEDQNLGSAIGNFAASLAGGGGNQGGGVTLKIPGAVYG